MTAILNYVVQVNGEGVWLDEEGQEKEPTSSDQIDVNSCDNGWLGDLAKRGLRAESMAFNVTRCVKNTAVGSSYVHIKGMDPSHGRNRI